MHKILFVNACARPCSRTNALAQEILQKLDGCVEEVRLHEIPMANLDLKGMEKREEAANAQDFSDLAFALARQFAAADILVIAAPYWDLMFPAVLKTYFENITISGVTFRYSNHGRPESLCKAKALYYVTTSGGFIGENDFGFSYANALAKNFFGITDVRRYSAEGLDIFGADTESILQEAKLAIAEDLQ